MAPVVAAPYVSPAHSGVRHDFGRIRVFSPGRVQAKLAVDQPGDIWEEEADRMADRVMRMPPAPVRGQAAREEFMPVNRGHMNHDFVHGLSGGTPLDFASRSYFEPRFLHDFSPVRVHADSNASDSARSLNALAYTAGHDIVFAAGQYAPETAHGRRLLAHELTHVVQQSQRRDLGIQRKGFWGAIGGFFSSFFHLAIDYSDKAIRKYLDLLNKTGEIEGDPDSDDKARQIVRDKKHLSLSLKIRTLLVEEMLDGFVSRRDERAIIEIIRSASPADRTAIVARIGRNKIWKEFNRKNRRIIEALTLTAADLKDSVLMARLRGLSESELADYQKNVVDPDVARAIDQILRQKRHELGSYPEQERRKISVNDPFGAGAEASITSDIEAAKAQQSKAPTISQTAAISTTTKSTVEIIEVPEIRIPANIDFECETRIGKKDRPGLERVGKHMISENNLASNTTRNLAIKELGKIYRFSRFDHPGAPGFTELVLIEEVGPLRVTPELTEGGWNVNQPRPGAMPAGSFKIRSFEFKRDQDWRADEWALVLEALTSFPDSVLKEVAGVNFRRRPCEDQFIKNGVCIPQGQRTGSSEAGERTAKTINDETITLFDEAFEASPSRYGISTILVNTLAHEVGHQVDLHSLDVALDTYEKGLAQARADLDKTLAEPEPPAKGKKSKKPPGEKSKHDQAWDKYEAERKALKEALDQSRSLSGAGWQEDSTKRSITEAPIGPDTDFLKAATRDGLVLTNGQITSGSISEYAKKSILEQFADLFATYLTDSRLLQAIRPNVHAYFTARFPR
jgi:hypothetical protein